MVKYPNKQVGEEINSETGEREYNEEGSESDSEDIQDIAYNPKERSNHVHFNVDDQRQYFEL